MTDRRSYSIRELADLSGFSPRTIHFYIRKGLLQGMGRRGPRTRYPAEHLDRLRLIQRLQRDERMTLDEIRDALQGSSPWTAAKVPTREEELRKLVETAVRGSGISPMDLISGRGRFSLEEIAGQAGIERIETSAGSRPPQSPSTPYPDDESGLMHLLSGLERSVGSTSVPRSTRRDKWTSVHITPDLMLSARGLRPHEISLLERVGDYLRQILEGRSRSVRPPGTGRKEP